MSIPDSVFDINNTLKSQWASVQSLSRQVDEQNERLNDINVRSIIALQNEVNKQKGYPDFRQSFDNKLQKFANDYGDFKWRVDNIPFDSFVRSEEVYGEAISDLERRYSPALLMASSNNSSLTSVDQKSTYLSKKIQDSRANLSSFQIDFEKRYDKFASKVDAYFIDAQGQYLPRKDFERTLDRYVTQSNFKDSIDSIKHPIVSQLPETKTKIEGIEQRASQITPIYLSKDDYATALKRINNASENLEDVEKEYATLPNLYATKNELEKARLSSQVQDLNVAFDNFNKKEIDSLKTNIKFMKQKYVTKDWMTEVFKPSWNNIEGKPKALVDLIANNFMPTYETDIWNKTTDKVNRFRFEKNGQTLLQSKTGFEWRTDITEKPIMELTKESKLCWNGKCLTPDVVDKLAKIVSPSQQQLSLTPDSIVLPQPSPRAMYPLVPEALPAPPPPPPPPPPSPPTAIINWEVLSKYIDYGQNLSSFHFRAYTFSGDSLGNYIYFPENEGWANMFTIRVTFNRPYTGVVRIEKSLGGIPYYEVARVQVSGVPSITFTNI